MPLLDEVKAQLARIKTAVHAGTLDKSTVDDALDKLHALHQPDDPASDVPVPDQIDQFSAPNETNPKPGVDNA